MAARSPFLKTPAGIPAGNPPATDRMSAFPPPQKESARLHDRYELLEEVPFVTGGRLFRARDLAFAEIVGIKYFQAERPLSPTAYRELEELVRHLQCLAHPHLVRHYTLDVAAGVLIHEWVQGISVLDLLRRRRALPVNEVLRLLDPLPATLDFLATEALSIPRPLLGKLYIQFENSAATEAAASASVERWPPFTLKVNALSLRDWATTSSADATTNLVIADPQRSLEISDRYGPKEFARLLYELFGGRIRELDCGRYSPIGALGEAGNAVLRHSLCAMPHATCESLWNDLIEAQPPTRRVSASAAGTVPPSRPLRIPDSLLSKTHPATILTLIPEGHSGPSIRLVARERFHLGRSPQQADFVTRILPVNEVNDVLTNRLSRVHSFLERTGKEWHVRDGNGKNPSLNGSLLNGQPLAADRPIPFTHRSILQLGDEYVAELVPVFSEAPEHPPISNLEAWSGGRDTAGECGHRGAVICLPTSGQAVVRHAAWLFTEAGFGLDAAENFIWDTRGRTTSPAAFHYHCGHFWLGNRSLPETALACGDLSLDRNEIAPLAAGQMVRMASRSFTVHLE